MLLLPIVSWIFLYLIYFASNQDWRIAIITASIWWGVLLTAITEILSLFRALNFWGLLISWSLASCVLGVVFIYRKGFAHRSRIGQEKAFVFSRFESFLLVGIVFIASITGLVAWAAPSNTVDAMTYHLARVVHWIQNETVFPYASHIKSQIYQNPWAQYALLHFQVLSDGDRFANFIQWAASIGNIIVVSAIAKVLGGDRTSQIFAAVLCATIPMGIIQAASTQNNHILAFWLLCFIYYVLLLIESKKNWNSWNLSNLGASLGLTILTKGTGYIYAFPFFLWFFLSGVKKFKLNFWKYLGIVGAIVLLINFGHYLRNYQLYGSPLGTDGHDYTNDVFGLSYLFSNLIRNIALLLASPIEFLNQLIENIVIFAHQILSLDVNDSRTTFSGHQFYLTAKNAFSENYTGNFIHTLLIIASTIFCLFYKKLEARKYVIIYLICTISTFLLFCLLIKWQPWHSRLHLPFFVIFSPLIGLMLSTLKHPIARNILLSILLISFIYLFCNAYKLIITLDTYDILNNPRTVIGLLKNPSMEEFFGGGKNIFIVPRIEQYFKDRNDLLEPYMQAINFLKTRECLNIGLYTKDQDILEYPIWLLLQDRESEKVRIKHVNVDNTSKAQSGKHEPENFIPCAIFVFNIDPDDRPDEMLTNKEVYHRRFSTGPVDILLKQ